MSNWSDDARSSNTRETCASIRGHASKLPLSSSYCVSSTLELDCVRPTIERLVDPSVTRLNGHRFTFAYSRGYFKYLVRTFDLGGFRAPPFKIVSCCSVNFKDLQNSIYIYTPSFPFLSKSSYCFTIALASCQWHMLFSYRERHAVFTPIRLRFHLDHFRDVFLHLLSQPILYSNFFPRNNFVRVRVTWYYCSQ